MILQTGGSELGATSTRSRSRSWAAWMASGTDKTPSCSPSSSMTRTSRARMSWFTRGPVWVGRMSRPRKRRPISGLPRGERAPLDVGPDAADGFLRREGSRVPRSPDPERNLARLRFPRADHEHVGDLLHLGLPDLIADLLVAEIAVGANALGEEPPLHLARRGGLRVGDSHHPGLHRGEPGGG